MSSSTPMISQTAWISIIPHFLVMGLIILIWNQFVPKNSIQYGAISYLLLSFSLRTIIPRNHRQGIGFVKLKKYDLAISKFQNSYDFFTKNEWIDKYRYITVLNSNKISYREMALNNMAFCYGQNGDGSQCKKYYLMALEEFPNSELAKSALNLLDSASKTNT